MMNPMSDEVIQQAEPSTPKEKKAAKSRSRKGGKKIRQVPQGAAHIQATFNNTIVTLTDPQGNVLAWSSAGTVGFKGPKKATPYAASVIVRDVAEKVKLFGLRDVEVFICGVGQGKEGAVRALNASGFTILSIKDVTPVPHNGCRPSRPRRV